MITNPVRVETLKQVAHLLATSRIMNRTSQRELGEHLHTGHGAVGFWERGEKSPTLNHFLAWCDRLGYEIIIVRKPVNKTSESPGQKP